MTSIHRPLRSAMAARLVGEDLGADVVRGPVGQGPGGIGALTDDPAALGRGGQPGGVAVGRHDDQLVEDRRRRLDRLEVDPLRLVVTLDDAPDEELHDRRRPTVDPPGEVADPDRQAAHLAPTEATLDGRAEPVDRLAVELVGLAGADQQEPARGQVAGRREGRAVALAGQLAERGQGRQLTAAAPIELAQRTVERGLADERDGQDIGGDVPRLIGRDTQVHRR